MMNEFTKDTTKPKPIRSREHKECYIYLHTVKQNSTHWWAWAKGFSFRLPLPSTYLCFMYVRLLTGHRLKGFGWFCIILPTFEKPMVKLFAGSTGGGQGR